MAICYISWMRARLRELFLSALPGSSKTRAIAADPQFDEQLDRMLAALGSELEFESEPDLELFATSLAALVEAAANVEQALTELGKLAVADFYLAAACARGEAKALRWFESCCGPELDRAIAKSPSLGLSGAEFRQLVLLRLFVSEPERPAKILSYRAQGSLKAWVRVMAARLIIDLSRRRAEPGGPGEALLDRMGGDEDLELDFLRRSYGPQLQQAFCEAIAALSVRQRNLLRQRYLHQMSADALARVYAVHRSTMFVWLEQARVALLAEIRGALAARVPGDELDSVVNVLGSKLQVSVRRLLDSQLESEGEQGL